MTENIVSFVSYDGLQLYGTFRKCDGDQLGTLLFVHGILVDREEGGFYTEFASRLAKIGISSLRFDFRCHGVDKTPFTELSLTGIVNDIDAAWNKLVQLAPSSNTYCIAASFGGGLTAYWAKQALGNRLNAAFLLYPVINYEWDVKKTSGMDLKEQLQNTGYIQYVDQKLSRALVNELPYINGIDAASFPIFPIIILHGTADEDVPFESSERYLARNENCQIVPIPDADHGFVAPGEDGDERPLTLANQETVYSYVLKYIEKGSVINE